MPECRIDSISLACSSIGVSGHSCSYIAAILSRSEICDCRISGFSIAPLPLFDEEVEVDGVAHDFVASVGWVKMIAGVCGGGEDGGIGVVSRGFVEVDEAVELAGGPDPLIDSLAHNFTGGGGIFGSDVGGEGSSVDLDAVGVGAGGELAEADDQVFGGDDVVRLDGVLGVADVVDAFEDDEVLDAGLGEDVAVEAGECVGAGVVVQNAVAANALVEDA